MLHNQLNKLHQNEQYIEPFDTGDPEWGEITVP